MATFNDLAVELQEAIWALVLPTRGVHWIEVEGIPQDPDYVRASIAMADRSHRRDRIPETYFGVKSVMPYCDKWRERARARQGVSTPFFQRLFTTVPAVFGRQGPGQDSDDDKADEIAYTRRCRQLSTYTQISTLLSTCRLSRVVAQQHIRDYGSCSWPIHRSLGPLYRPRPVGVWEAQYGGDKSPLVAGDGEMEVLAPRIRPLDLVVFRLHDSQGRGTPLLRHAAWQYRMDVLKHPTTTYGCFERIGIEWCPSWGTMGGRGELRPGNVQAIVKLMSSNHKSTTLYWLVDGVPRPNWKHDHPAIIGDMFADGMAMEKDEDEIPRHLEDHWGLSRQEGRAMLSDCHLDQEFEANGRRYYVVFVVLYSMPRRCLFPGGADLWPEALREPVRLAHEVIKTYATCNDESLDNMGTHSHSYILSWEPI